MLTTGFHVLQTPHHHLAEARLLKAFILPLKNSEGLPPFQCVAGGKEKAIYKYSLYVTVFQKLDKSAQRSVAEKTRKVFQLLVFT